MADKHSKEVRSYNMSQIKGKNTKPEMLVRKYLHAQGVRSLPSRGNACVNGLFSKGLKISNNNLFPIILYCVSAPQTLLKVHNDRKSFISITKTIQKLFLKKVERV